MEKAAVTCLCWVPKGKSHPRQAGEDEDADRGRASASGETHMQGLEEFDMDNYDDDADQGMNLFTVLNSDLELAKEKDPYIEGDPDSDSGSEAEYDIKADDQVFMAATCDEDDCTLELFTFDEEDASMYVHHDVMLTAYPLCVEWLSGMATTNDGSFAALGLIDHTIQIWDLDDLEPEMPSQCLGPLPKAPKGKKGRRTRGAPSAEAQGMAQAHDGPVLCLHGSPFNRSVLVSGSADQTVKVWDINENSCVHTYSHHSNKVQCARWHPTEQAVLLSAAFDRNLALLDVRQPGKAITAPLPAEAEAAIWSRHRPFECIASGDNGSVVCFDVRKVAAKASEEEYVLWSLQAHDVACTSVQDCPAPDCLVTAGLDGYSKVWKQGGKKPKMVFEKNLKAGPVFCCMSDPESPALFLFGGQCPVMWDLTSEAILCGAFSLEGQASQEAAS
mmetsp:Transcript_58291/g.131286  ORF Transcript_58291/g.131286 Transcript_58291/m.131286 type:complete len:445 (+) Transcript_58291:92-1426(+)